MKILLLIALLVLASSKSEYRVTATTTNTSSVTLTLAYTGKDDYYLKPTSPIIKNLKVVFQTHTFTDFIIKITNNDKPRFEVPQNGVIPKDPVGSFSYPMAASAVAFEYTQNPFDFKVTRKDNGAVLFSTYDKNIIYSEHYLEIGTEVDSPFIYGLGERFSTGFRVKQGKWTMFTRERGFQLDDGSQGKNAYGYFPFYWLKQKGDLFHINYLRSSNAMDVLKTVQNGKHYLTYKVIGGIFDFRFILGGSNPEDLLRKYNQYYGGSAVPPFWSLGFHQSRWGYQNITFLTDVIEGYQSNKIPLDGIWTDIDYMVEFQDFTIDQARFPLDELAKIRQKYKWIPIIDAGIKTVGYAYEQGLRRGVFTRDANGSYFVGKVWPGNTVFVDHFHPNSTQYWLDMLDLLYNKLQFDGLWLDMNEIDNFCDGPCGIPTQPKIFDYAHDLPYNPGNDNIQSHTIPLNCTHYGNLSEADVHIFHSHLQAYASNLFFQNKNKTAFFITRSTTVGTAKYGFHWTGDNNADWGFLRGSINHILNNQLYGMQMVGSDICGFGGQPSVDLCSRWYQLGTLYPFSRSHNMIGYPDQAPYAMGPIVQEAATKAIRLRYSLLKHFYTQFVVNAGEGAFWKPLFFLFPNDPKVYQDQIAETQFMIGNQLLAAPIVEQSTTSRTVYLPAGNWFQYHTGKPYSSGTYNLQGYSMTDMVPLFLRQGSLVMSQSVSQVGRSADLSNRFELVAAFRFNEKRSNATHKCYSSYGGILSLQDYNDKDKLHKCLKSECYFNLTLELAISDSDRVLEIFGLFYGDESVRELIWVDQLTLYYDWRKITFRPNPIDIQYNYDYTKVKVPEHIDGAEILKNLKTS